MWLYLDAEVLNLPPVFLPQDSVFVGLTLLSNMIRNPFFFFFSTEADDSLLRLLRECFLSHEETETADAWNEQRHAVLTRALHGIAYPQVFSV